MRKGRLASGFALVLLSVVIFLYTADDGLVVAVLGGLLGAFGVALMMAGANRGTSKGVN